MLKLDQLIVFEPNNFTPLTRTPWAGSAISQKYKNKFVDGNSRIGESWEFSCDPDFPSKIMGTNHTLLELVQKFPVEILSNKLAQSREFPTCEILVKLINASIPLSFQVHPGDGDKTLLASESGKPETWYVLDHEPGAGLYIGFSESISKAQLRTLLETGQDLHSLLQFVPVKVGDYFEIEPSTPHAIGKGVTLLEPQRVIFGKSGKTYRMWDWGRKYDSLGHVDDKNGKRRKLHIDSALQLIDPETQVGTSFVEKTRRFSQSYEAGKNCKITEFPANNYCQLFLIDFSSNANLTVSVEDGYGICLQLSGALSFSNKTSKSQLNNGYSALMPHLAFPMDLNSQEACTLAIIIPVGSKLNLG